MTGRPISSQLAGCESDALLALSRAYVLLLHRAGTPEIANRTLLMCASVVRAWRVQRRHERSMDGVCLWVCVVSCSRYFRLTLSKRSTDVKTGRRVAPRPQRTEPKITIVNCVSCAILMSCVRHARCF
jgi:hypothetical protein